MTKAFVNTCRHGTQTDCSSHQAGALHIKSPLAIGAAPGSRNTKYSRCKKTDGLYHRLKDGSDHDGEGTCRSRRVGPAADLSRQVFAGADAAAPRSGFAGSCIWGFREGSCDAGARRQEIVRL